MWLVMTMQDFELEPLNFFIPVKVDMGKMIGFAPIYKTLEDAKSEFPNRDYVEIKESNERDVPAREMPEMRG